MWFGTGGEKGVGVLGQLSFSLGMFQLIFFGITTVICVSFSGVFPLTNSFYCIFGSNLFSVYLWAI